MRARKVTAAAVALVHVWLVAAPASAQPACDTSCPIRMRDARGCCPGAAAPPAPSSPPRAPPLPSAPAPAPQPRPKPTANCPVGQEVAPDTQGHCCWPGQAWAGTKCVGEPTSCPNGYDVDASAQACKLQACSDGRVRAADGVHCCFPGQAWSVRGECIGVPTCPQGMAPSQNTCVSADIDGDGIPNEADKCPEQAEDRDGFQDADGCPDPDNDRDGVPDGSDRCPTEAEDKNGYKDDDGCPDEQERLAVVAARQRADEANRAEERRRNEAEQERQRQESERKAVEDEREGRAARRSTGLWLGGTGVALEGLAVVFAVVANGTNSTIKDGGLATAADIESTNSKGKTFDTLAIVSAALGGVCLAVGVPLFLLNAPAPGRAPSTGKVRFTPRGLEF